MLDEEESVLVAERGIEDRCGRRKIVGGKGCNIGSVKGAMDELRRMGVMEVDDWGMSRWGVVERPFSWGLEHVV